MKLDRYTTQELIDELALREQLRVIRDQSKHSRYCTKLGGNCKYMDGECTAQKCRRVKSVYCALADGECDKRDECERDGKCHILDGDKQ